ncbi:MAG: hypothetical protein LLG04_04725, partial [Parachlamydia sp.]|nr:hypothetical protein [Parachlamydia sp.]
MNCERPKPSLLEVSNAIQIENIPSAVLARVSKHLKLEGYLVKGENYRIGLDATHRFGNRLTTVNGDAITPDLRDRIITIVARDLANPDETHLLRLPSTVFNGVASRAVFICDNQLIELTLSQQKNPDLKWQVEFEPAKLQLWKKSNAEGKWGQGRIEYENLNDIPADVRHIDGRVLSPRARIYDCITKQWREITSDDLQALNNHYQKVGVCHEDVDIREPDSDETNLNQLWYVPEWFSKNKYEFLTLVVDDGMLILAGQPKETTETKKPFFFVRVGPMPSGQIDQNSLSLSYIKDSFCANTFGKV